MTVVTFVRRAAFAPLALVLFLATPRALRAGEPGDAWFGERPWDLSVSVNRVGHRGQDKFGGRIDGFSDRAPATGAKVEVRYGGRGHFFRYGLSLAWDRSRVNVHLPAWFQTATEANPAITLGEVTRLTPAFEWEIHPFRDEHWDLFAGPGLEYATYSFAANATGPALGITDPKIKGGLRLSLRGGVQYILNSHWAARTEMRWAKAEAKFDATVNPPLESVPLHVSSPLRKSAVTLSLGATYRF